MNIRWILISFCFIIGGIYLNFQYKIPFSWLLIIIGILALITSLIKTPDYSS